MIETGSAVGAVLCAGPTERMGYVHVTREDIERGFAKLAIDGGVIVHSSLSSFGYVEGGAEAVVDALLSSFPLVMVPAFTWGTMTRPPEGVHIERNGWRPHRHRHPRWRKWVPVPFRKDMAAGKSMGAITEALRRRPGAARGIHPTHSLAAVGEHAEEIIATQTYDDPMGPIKALAERGGWILMLGTELTSCTPIHAAEDLAGRKHFIRFSPAADGGVLRIATPGCSRGFAKFEPVLSSVKREVRIGRCRVRAYPGGDMMRLCVDAMKRNPEITLCRPDCPSCRDLLAGGPIE